ncbi:MAG: MXAN_6640 family putative metalloprotease, partial [bacterium]
MRYTLIITFILSLYVVFLQAEDSHTAIMHYLQSTKTLDYSLSSAYSVDARPIKSLMIHPSQRERILGKAQFSRPIMDKAYIRAAGHFKFHYTTTGYDAVEALSTNEDNVPDYIYEAAVAAEYVYRILIDTLEFAPPPVDNYEGMETDIYVMNFGGSAYAYTHPEDEVFTTNRSYDYTAYIEIDNDYKESNYTTNGLDGLRVTVAHEYFHVVQLGYNWWESNGLLNSGIGDQYFLEWSSTWFEERAYPEINDYIQYLGDFFYNPVNSIWDSDYAYTMGPFIYFLNNVYGQYFIQKTWEKIKGQYALQSLIEAVSEYGGDLATQYNNYVNACYFTGSRYNETYPISPDAIYFPELSFTNESFTEPLTIDDTIKPLATRPYKITFNTNQYL